MIQAPDVRVLYLHGFRSAPQSTKARQTVAFCEQQGLGSQLSVPYLNKGPSETIAELERMIDGFPEKSLALIGSSLGGFYASFLASKYRCPAVLINPAVRPFELWQQHLGEHENFYTGDTHQVHTAHIDELRALDVQTLPEPGDFMVLLETGDETLDYQQAEEKFAESRLVIHQGGNHSYEHYQQELPMVFDFLISRI